jgi:hypothetical protein
MDYANAAKSTRPEELKSTVTSRLARIEEQLSGAGNTAGHLLDVVRGSSVPTECGDKIPTPGCVHERLSLIERQVSRLNETLESLAGEL